MSSAPEENPSRSPRRIALFVIGAAIVFALVAAIALRHSGPPHGPEGGPAAMRIISLNPNITEILFELGLGDRIVGAADYSDYPPEARRIPRVGGLGNPNIETLLALQPTLVIATNLDAYDGIRRLQASGVRLLQVPVTRVAQLFTAIRRIGEATGTGDRADALVARLRAELEDVARTWHDVPPAERPRVFLEIWKDPLGTAGGPSFLSDVIERAGGVNVAAALEQSYPIINPETVVAWNPDVIVLGYMTRKGAAREVAGRIGWDRIAAVRSGRIVTDIHPDLLLRPGPRIVRGIRLLAERLYPDADTDEPDRP
jgi:iron complex transport system substrate-binding protein